MGSPEHLHRWAEGEAGWACVVCGVTYEDRVKYIRSYDTKVDALPDRQRRVFEVLRDGAWHDGHELTRPDVGGSEGLRRLRELRAKGYVIHMRTKTKGRTTRQYKLDRR